MGTYYIFCSHSSNEYIEPGDVDNGAIKFPGIMFGNGWQLALFCTSYMWNYDTPHPETKSHTPWESVIVIGDNESEYDTILETYTDVTKEAVIRYNDMIQNNCFVGWPKMKYTPDEDA